jgi:PleD family two-component response regulator
VAHVLDRIAAAGVGLRPDGVPLTISVGVAERLADRVTDWDRLVDLADERMYAAKNGGTNAAVGPLPACSRRPLIDTGGAAATV